MIKSTLRDPTIPEGIYRAVVLESRWVDTPHGKALQVEFYLADEDQTIQCTWHQAQEVFPISSLSDEVSPSSLHGMTCEVEVQHCSCGTELVWIHLEQASIVIDVAGKEMP